MMTYTPPDIKDDSFSYYNLSHLQGRHPKVSRETEHPTNILNEQRPWGSFELFTCNEKSTVKLLHVAKGKRLSLQYHTKRSELWKVVAGEVSVNLNSTTVILRKGHSITVPVGAIHRIQGIEDSIILEIAFGVFIENDIIRLEDDFGRSEVKVRRNQVTTKTRSRTVSPAVDMKSQSIESGTDIAVFADMIRTCKEEENIERRIDILRKINALLPQRLQLLIPSLITIHYIDHAISDIEEKLFVATGN